jgi:hypothetical protein
MHKGGGETNDARDHRRRAPDGHDHQGQLGEPGWGRSRVKGITSASGPTKYRRFAASPVSHMGLCADLGFVLGGDLPLTARTGPFPAIAEPWNTQFVHPG